jgi:hypothetical protein
MTQVRVAELPAEDEERAKLLNGYFSSLLVADAQPAGDGGWIIDVERPDDLEVFVDPGLADVLGKMGVIQAREIGLHVWNRDGFQLALEDSWTALSWSRWLSMRERDDAPDAVVLHVDDHRDFQSPHLALGPDGFTDLITGEPVLLHRPATVRDAVRSGAIGVAGFFAPFVRRFGSLEVRHLRAGISAEGEGWRPLLARDQIDGVLRPGHPRPAIELGAPGKGEGAALRYMATSDLQRWLRDLPRLPVLLHIDLDYLSNRFNGDSDWQRGPRHDPPPEVVRETVIGLFDALEASGVAQAIVDVAVALSPGFFPAEYWLQTIAIVEERVSRLGVRRSPNLDGSQ